MEASGGADEAFEVSAEPGTTAPSAHFEGANVCRVAAISAMLGDDRVAVADVAEPLRELGFGAPLRSGLIASIDTDPFESLAGLWPTSDEEAGASRVDLWRHLNERGDPEAAIGFLVAVLGSPFERESAAAAAALWRQVGAID